MLLERLARGGMGEIFLGQKAAVAGEQRYVALKTLRQDLTRDEEYVTRFLDEARVAIVLKHPVINKVFDIGFAEGTYFLELEYISGRDARSVLERARDLERQIPPEIAYYVVGELLDALGYLHQARDLSGATLNLIHRDVSPQNLMVSWQGDVRLIDFGLARFAARTTATEPGMVLGKLRYMAPEQARGHDIDHRVDLFAAGVMLYELLSGRRLYDDVDPNQLWSIVARGQALEGVRRERLPPAMVPVVERALAVQPDDRYPDAAALLADLRAQSHWTHEQARQELVGLLADLFEVDLKLEKEFMQQLGRMAPFDLSTDESTHSVSLADPTAAVPESTLMSDGPAAVFEAATAVRTAVGEDTPAIPEPVDPREPTAPLPAATPAKVEFAAPIALPAEVPAIRPAAAIHGEQTFIVPRTGEHPLPAPAVGGDRMPREVQKTGHPAAQAIAAQGSQHGRDEAERSMFAGRARPRLLVLGGVAASGALLGVVLLWAMLGGPDSQPGNTTDTVVLAAADTPASADAGIPELAQAASGEDDLDPPPRKPRVDKPPRPERDTPPQARVDNPVKPPPGTTPGHPRQPKKPPRADPVRPPPVKPPPVTTVAPPVVDPKPVKPPAVPRPARSNELSAAATNMIRELDRALGSKGLLPDDAVDLWPEEYKAAKNPNTDDGVRRELVGRLKGKIDGFTFRKTFINNKLNRVQTSYYRIRPRLDDSSELFKGLEAQLRSMLLEYRAAGSDPAKLVKVNSTMNLMLLRLREAQY